MSCSQHFIYSHNLQRLKTLHVFLFCTTSGRYIKFCLCYCRLTRLFLRYVGITDCRKLKSMNLGYPQCPDKILSKSVQKFSSSNIQTHRNMYAPIWCKSRKQRLITTAEFSKYPVGQNGPLSHKDGGGRGDDADDNNSSCSNCSV